MRTMCLALGLLTGVAYADIPEESSPELRDIVRVYTHDVVMCLGRAHKKGRTPAGSLLMRVDIIDNHADAVAIERDATESKGLAKCVRRRMGAWLYQDLPDGHYTWQFEMLVADR